jgi:hypothetical protein
MTVQEAFELLGVDPYASEEVITKAFRKESKKVHPDLNPEEANEKQALLNKAHEIAEAFMKVRFSIIPIEQVGSTLNAIEKDMRLSNYREETRSYIRKLQIKTSSPIHRLKYMLWAFAGLCAFLTFMGKESLSELTKYPQYAGYVKVMILISGCGALFTQLLLDNIKNKLEYLNDSFQDKQFCAGELSRCLNYENIKTADRIDFYQNIRMRPSEVPRLPGFTGIVPKQERIKIMLLKAKETGLIEIVQSKEIRPGDMDKIVLNFNPADFGQKKEPEEIKKRQPRTIGELKTDVKLYTSGTVIFGIVTAAIIIIYKSYWAFAPGFFLLIYGTNFLIAKSEIREKLKSGTEED